MVRVALAAAVPALRLGLREMLQGAGFLILDEGADAGDLDLANVDVLVLAAADWEEWWSKQGNERAEASSSPALVILSEQPNAAARLAALGLPGWAWLPEAASAGLLAAAVAAAAAGLAAAPAGGRTPASAEHALATLTPAALPVLEEPLTPRELEVLRLLAKGLPNKQIARELTISEHTVKFHVSAIYAKLGAASRTEAVSQAARRGLVAL